jgi:hypothetical protein
VPPNPTGQTGGRVRSVAATNADPGRAATLQHKPTTNGLSEDDTAKPLETPGLKFDKTIMVLRCWSRPVEQLFREGLDPWWPWRLRVICAREKTDPSLRSRSIVVATV